LVASGGFELAAFFFTELFLDVVATEISPPGESCAASSGTGQGTIAQRIAGKLHEQ
jgi:hypothetical protein